MIVTSCRDKIVAEIRQAKWSFYVYVLHKPDGQPFYVGCSGNTKVSKGHQRIFHHEKHARFGKNTLKHNVIRKIWSEGGQAYYSIDSWHLDERSMFDRESHPISSLGRRDHGAGILANGNDGGTGLINPGALTREKIKEGHRKRWTPERREDARQRALENYSKDPSLRKRIGESSAPRWTEEERRKQAERAKLGMLRPEVREKVRIKSPEQCAAQAITLSQRYKDDPELKRRLSEAQANNWRDPAYRARVLATRERNRAKRLSAEIEQKVV